MDDDIKIFEEIHKAIKKANLETDRSAALMERMEKKITDISIFKASRGAKVFWLVVMAVFLTLCVVGAFLGTQWAIKSSREIKEVATSMRITDERLCKAAGGLWNENSYFHSGMSNELKKWNTCLIFNQK